MEITLNKKVARKVLTVVDKGLVSGLGVAEPGKMCVEAAVCYALGLPHGDNPKCVGSAVRDFKINLNDSHWPSDKDRTRGMRKLAIAQLGSNELDQSVFTKKVGFRCMTTVLPLILENALKEDKDNEFVKKNLDMNAVAKVVKELKAAKTFEEAKKAAQKARDIYYASTYASTSASTSASTYASTYAYAYAYASTSTYAYAYASTSTYAYAYAYASTYAYASAYAYAEKNPRFSLKILNTIAKAGLDTLIEMKSPGAKWLDLCE